MSDDIFEADDLFEQADDVFEPADDLIELADDDAVELAADEVGLTSQESPDAPVDDVGDDGSTTTTTTEKKSFLKSFTVFDGLLLASLICVSLATLFLFIELNKFGSFPGGFPWRTTEFLNQ